MVPNVMIEVATSTSAAPYHAGESSTCKSVRQGILPIVSDHMNLADINEKWLTFPQADGERLLPGILNDITLAHIVPKLTWRDFYTLAAVSPAWCHAIRSRQVHDARVDAGSGENIVLFSYMCSETSAATALYSMHDNSCSKLPPIPEVGHPAWFKRITFEGKIYVLGEWKRNLHRIQRAYVFDLVGQRHWQQCASIQKMKDLRACDYDVWEGKIYALGGCNCELCPGSKVYDPLEDTWSPIKPLEFLRYGHQVLAGGDQLYVRGGIVPPESDGRRIDSRDDELAFTVDIYDILQDEWRKGDWYPLGLGDFLNDDWDVLFVAKGKFHVMTMSGIHVYNTDANSWTHLHTHSFITIGPPDVIQISYLLAALAVEDELLAVVDFLYLEEGANEPCLIRSRGFGGENKELAWQKAQIPQVFADLPDELFQGQDYYNSMSLVQV